MDAYDKKFAEMQKYIPFLEAMIERLQNVKDKNREIQLQKMQGLHGILSNSKRKLKIETLQRCEDVLQKLHNRVEKFQGNTPGLQLPTKQNDGTTPQPSTSSEGTKSDQHKKAGEQPQDAEKDIEIEETPASPDTVRSSSPDCQILPVIIPTERNTYLSKNKSSNRRRQLRKIPVITLTDRTREITISSPTDSNSEDVSFTEWDLLEESERHTITKSRSDWQPSLVVSGHDVATAAKLISNNLPQKVNDGRNYIETYDVPTVPVPSLGGSRRLTSVLEKNKLHLDLITDNSSRPESPVNVPEVRLKSPDPEILFAKSTSPRSKDSHMSSKLPSKPSSIPLLFSPPPFSSEPPLSMEDLAELLNDEGDSEKRSDKADENAAKHQKDSGKQEATKDGKVSKGPLLSDRENEKRSEEVDKHTIKITPRKSLSNAAGTSGVKSSEIKGPSHQLNDHRSASQTPFPNSKFQEPRYADNYERHPRQRDSHGHESVKDKLAANSNIPEETSPQISILYHNITNKPDERNVPLYQRRSSLPPEGRKDTATSARSESEFLIEGIDYYNMHLNQMHWSPSAVTTSDHAFGNAQWTPPAYGGIAQSSLQPTQHPYQHPMEPQFRPNQFPAGPTLPAAPRPPLITPTARPQDMNHVTRSENIREDISPLLSSPTFPVASQYRGFQMGQGSYDPAFSVDRSTEYPHVRPNWEGPPNRTGENVIPCGIQVVENSTGTSYPRPSTPYPWGTRDRPCNRGRGRDGYYEKNRTEVRPGFNRRSDWPRDGFPNRDPRVRTDHNTTNLNQTKETGGSARDPRLAKDKHVNAPTKAKDAAHNERDPRKRPTILKTTKEKTKSRKSDSEKEKVDKQLSKDRMQSPLESLYGVIDTKASQSSGLQKFKIPKIKRPEPPQQNRVAKTKETENISRGVSRTKSDNKKKNKNSRSENRSKDDASAEVSSSSDSSHVTQNQSRQNDAAKEGEIISSLVEETNKNEVKIGEADSVMSDSKFNDMEKSKKNESEADEPKPKEEVTQEWIEALIRKSFESGEGKKLFEQAKLIQKLGEALETKKLKKIKKIIESESESSSDKDEAKVEAKKTLTKKKRRVIVSDSSDDECLAERLEVLTAGLDTSDERTALASATDLQSLEEKNETTIFDNVDKEPVKDITTKKNNSSSGNCNEKRDVQVDDNNKSKSARLKKKSNKENDRLKDRNEKTDVQSENNKQVNSRLEDDDKAKKQAEDKVNQISVEKSKDKSNVERSLNQDKDQTECAESVSDTADGRADEISGDKPKVKTKRRNSLEMLQEDIREMFISKGVVSATGYRMCRLPKEDQSPPGMSSGTLSTSSKKDETSSSTERKIAESSTETVVNNTKLKKVLRSRNSGESSKPKANTKKDIKRTRNLRSKEFVSSSDSEEDQPLALRTERLSSAGNKKPNQKEERNEETEDLLRRSKRVLRKDVVKEPRVLVEKTDIAKIDLSKVMFDSSSDESFGIDVSELAAAVESSLRPEKQSDQDSVDTVASLRRRRTGKNVSKQSSKSKKNSSLLTDDKSEDGMSFTDEESVLSDISMSSSTIAGKRTSGGSARTSTREELLSNILVGLVPATTEKNASLTDKGSEADLDEDTNEPPIIETNAKKTSTKKKKKKSSWQMGIVSTKKRKKKTALAASSKTAQTNMEETNTGINVSMDTVEDNRSISEELKNKAEAAEKPSEDNRTVDDANVDFSVKCDIKLPIKTDIKLPIKTDNFDIDFDDINFAALSETLNAITETLSAESLISIEENKPTIKIETEVSESTTDTAVIEPPSTATAYTFCKETSKILYDEQMEELFGRIEIKQLTDYIWTGQDKYKCLLCIFTGKNIVHHYKMNHPGREVIIARLNSTNAEAAILESSATAAASATEATSQVCKFRCRFCYYVTEGAADVALEAFYEHCTTHTGEYRFHCNSCSYQAVAKASMRTHYYKMCRKHNDTFNESASEDHVPQEGAVYGYLCRGCNYVQLKRHNVEAHVAFWHRDTETSTEILKINMSATSVESIASSSNEMSQEPASANAEESFAVETKAKILEDVENKDVLEMNVVREVSQDNNDNTGKEYILREPKTEEAIEIKEEETEERSAGGSQEEPEGPVSTGNLSVFVCPPELENKEDEIQRERQKMMQEIANNIGILKNYSKPDLSIIDKLQDKMRTDAVVSPVPECDSSAPNVPETRENPSLPLTSSTVEFESNNVIIKKDTLSQDSNNQENPSSSTEEHSNKSEVTNDKTDGIKIRDPLVIMDPCKKDDDSDGEISDNERSAPVFESDSSSEQSDSEPPTDVNMILKETSSMNASSSRDPMLTTIQRLVAQLQNVKPLEPVPEPILDIKVEIKSEPMSSIPNPPDVVPIATAKRLLAKESNVKHLSKTPETSKPRGSDASPPKNFIRLRRLSGDMLSMPVQSSDNQEDTRASSTDGTQSDSAMDESRADTEEECSFLKIENVISLAPKSDNTGNESPIVNDIRRAVEISPKNKIPILRKSNQPIILKKFNIISPSLASAQGIQPSTSEHVTLFPVKSPPTSSAKSASTHRLPTNFVPISPKMRPVTVSSTVTSPPNLKIVKVVRTPLSLVKSAKDVSISSIAVKLKSVDAYAAMMTETKLVHFFKCMGRDCHYTTDTISHYYQHYLQHCEASKRNKSVPPHDYEKCPYCYMSLNSWISMKTHLWEKHSSCRYQCVYCFYRALTPSYVQQHQTTCHPGSRFYFLLGKLLKSIQKQEDINRRDYVKPFVCKQDCGKFFYVLDSFTMHLKEHQSSHLTCHLCNSTHETIKSLISHYKLHGYSKYQCIYCLCGTETLIEMHQHLSAFHCNRLPQTLERSLLPTAERSADVIQQLVMRTFDEPMKVDEGNVESSADDSKKDTSMKDAINDRISAASLNVEIASNQERSKASNNPAVPSFTSGISSNTEANANVPNTSGKQSIDASLAGGIAKKASKNAAEKQPLQNKSFLQGSEKGKLSTVNQILQEQALELLSCINDSGAVDPLEFSSEFDCSNEFVSTNLLDNPEFLKNLSVNSSNASFSNDDAATSADKMEDSDIEILENIESGKKIAEKKNVEGDANHLTADSKSSVELKIEKKEQSALCDTIEDKCTSVKASTSADAQSERPLTLDDIKDTGRAGLELYKCGYLECSFAALNSGSLRTHIKSCNFGEPVRNLFCPHCKKRFIRIGFLLGHMQQAHGLKRFGCSLCKNRYTGPHQATQHMKTKHKHLNTKLVPADPTNPSAEGLFIVQATPFGSAERKTKKRKGAKSGAEQETEKTTDFEKLSFSPDEIEQLPRQAIYNREVQCAVCPYTTKVRTNIVRHLQLHAKDQTVPESGPVNPVPCLDKKEKMFDKMVNLASSSHQNGRMGGKSRETVKESEEDDSIPKFVPEHKRYVCSVAECNYLTVDEAMLRYHLKALHSEEPYFRCPHCPPPPPGQESQNIAIDKMGVHLKMHDTRLYKCSHCNHHHYHRHVVERHLTDKHPEKRPFVKVVREVENTENVQQPVNEETEEEVPDPDGNHWKCNLCDFKCVYKADITAHADTVHGENCQYKCTLCSFKTSGKIIEQHISGKHACDSNADYTVIYQRIKGVNKRNVEATEQGGQDEPFDTTPLWRRSMPRIRHIRGILLEEEIEDPATSEGSSASKVSLGKRKNDTEVSMKPAKVKSAGKSGDENNKQFKEKSKRSLSCDKLSEEAEGNGQVRKESEQSKADAAARGVNKSAKDSKTGAAELNDSDVGRFGPYGKPDGNLYICTLCNHFKTKYKHDMRDHLYRELNYARWHCKACGYLSVNRNALIQHFGKRHNGECLELSPPLSPDNAIEDWVKTLLKKQTDMIKAASKNINVIYKSVAISGNTSAGSREVDNTISPKKIQTNDKRAVNLAPTISNLQNDILRDANRSSIDTDDGDSRDEDLIIDMKEDEAFESRNNENKPKNDKFCEKSEEISEKPLVCKHCQMIFNRPRGLKLHIQYSHLKRLGFLCPYCDRSTNSETMMRQHIRSKHPKDPEKIIHNPSAWENTKLTNEFWEKEYGIVCPPKSKKRKFNADAGDATASSNYADMREKCEVCGFHAMNYTGLKSHMRSHATSKHNLKCSYCTYSCFFKAELLEHWEFNHPTMQLKYQELSSAAESSCDEATSKSSTPKKRDIDTCDVLVDDIEEEEEEDDEEEEEEEEPAISIGKPTPTMIYSCFYCIFRSNSLPSVKRHWSLVHKESKGPEATFNAKINLPFRYKEIPLPRLSSPKDCANKSVVETSPRDFVERSENLLSPIVVQRRGWICQWDGCQEFCETDADKITHQNMFHSHLPPKWQEQRQQQKQNQSKGTSIRLPAYSATKYSSLAAKTESIPNLNSIVDNLMTNQARRSLDFGDAAMKSKQSHISKASLLKSGGAGSQAVARKSTTRSTLPTYARPGPRVFKAVARKSTNPLPRYPSGAFMSYRSMPRGIKTELEAGETESEPPSSHYGIPSSPINLGDLKTYMVVGGHKIRLTCLKLSSLINIDAKIQLEDVRKDPEYAAILSNFD
ncbi:unnamed protein product [Lasius platythorax]|uniref:C2H2-type domain-containing protein n=1 Tax=Lasius platythorax TaxID=488582 RepID=A0AAV2N0M2_9HYME